MSGAADETAAPSTPQSPTPQSATLRWGVLAVLVVLIAGSAVALGVQAVHRGGNPFSSVDERQEARDDVMSQARQFMLRVNTYGPDLLKGTTMPTYRDRVRAVVTAKFEADFEKNVPYAEATVAQAGLERTTQVYAVGVGDLDLDRGRATALVAGAFTNSFPDPKDKKKRVAADPQPYRVEVTLVEQSGRWKVDAFTPVGAQPSSPGTAPSSPAAPSTTTVPTPGGGAQ